MSYGTLSLVILYIIYENQRLNVLIFRLYILASKDNLMVKIMAGEGNTVVMVTQEK